MIKRVHQMTEPEAWAELARSPAVHLASSGRDGRPILRTLHAIVADGALAFHGSPTGDKRDYLGREAVVACERVVAEVPSYFVDPERACPATTFYVSVQAEGIVEEVVDRHEKAACIAALMGQYQPEGGHVPVDADHPLYRAAIGSIAITRVRPRRVTGKRKLGQHKRPEDVRAILAGLWRRGAPGDLAAFEEVRAAYPGDVTPDFLRAPEGYRYEVDLPADRASEVLPLLRDGYWHEGRDPEAIVAAHRGTTAWVGCRAVDSGELVGTARANADGGTQAFVYDVAVAPRLRGSGLGRALMTLLLDHPKVRGADMVRLVTRDAQGFYERLGFGVSRQLYTTMHLSRRG